MKSKNKTVLDFLRENRSDPISGEEISQRLRLSRSAVWKEIQNLKSFGYEIEAQPHLGYRLLSIPDKLFADELSVGLGTKTVGNQIFSYESLDSTNDTCFELGKKGIPEGACIFSEFQKKGRGRLGREWLSPKGKNILFSVLLRPVLTPSEVAKMTLTASLAVVRVLQNATNKKLGIKWPNDILFEEKKVAGILTEMQAEADRVDFIVIGIGINVNSSAKDLPSGAFSVKEVLGESLHRLSLAREILRELDADYLRLKKEGFAGIAKEWEDFSVTSGRRVLAKLLGRSIQGQAVGIDKDGALWIRQDSGLQEKVMAGDIQHLR